MRTDNSANNGAHHTPLNAAVVTPGVGDEKIEIHIESDRATAYGITMKVFKVVLDTNILVSGLRSKRGASYKLLTLLGEGRFTTAVSVPLVVEYEKALVDPRTKVPFSRADIGKFIDYICTVSDKRKIYYLWRPYLPDPGDDMILELAVAGRCDFIVTYNIRDFKGVKQFGIKILMPGQLIKLLGEEQ